MNTTDTKIKQLAKALGILQLFIGLGAVAGGLGFIIDPSGADLRIPLDMLQYSPFSDFLIPGIVLLIVNGLGSITGSILSFRLIHYAGEVALALGAFLVAWIVIQVYWIESVHWLHIFYFILGIIELSLGWFLRKAVRA